MLGGPRRHHYVPQFYLANFTREKTKNGTLFVWDLTTGDSWESSPRDSACERDFYRVEGTEADPNEVERALGDLEGRAAPVVAQICETGTLPSASEDYYTLMTFIALMAVRGPRMRHNLARPMERVAHLMLVNTLSSRETYHHIIDQMRAEGIEVGNVPFEHMKRFVEEGRYKLRVAQNFLIDLMFEAVQVVIPLLFERTWSLVLAAEGHLICSDRPVSLTWADGTRSSWPPGFGVKNTIITIPLSANTALLGRFEGRSAIHRASLRGVAPINSRTAAAAHRFVYSLNANFLWARRDGSLLDARELTRGIKSGQYIHRYDQ